MTNRIVIVGGGLSGGLAALALAEAGAPTDITLVEAGDRLGGNHTWSFHETDLAPDDRAWVAPFVTASWPRQEVRFPGYHRTLAVGYRTVTSETFDRVTRMRLASLGGQILWRTPVDAITATEVRLASGRVLTADVVIDARGPERAASASGFQKFVGVELELDSHGSADGPWAAPVVMDATVPQIDGYRFIYVLPFTARRVLVEDTVYADGPDLDAAGFEARALEYAASRGARVSRILRRESGVLPLPFGDEGSAFDVAGGPLRVGYRGGFFHPVTGYSLPLAVRVARALAQAGGAGEMRRALVALWRTLTPQRRLAHLLNRLLFGAMAPDRRWTALKRFYRLPEATIARFYASQTTALDRVRILLGRPPAGLSWRRWMGAAEAA